ncbi:MAG: hypothetical protein PHS57_04680 [Alphaproteobacteria bacterium]|nr:hypothetical protein [Alphaproteobacteria bacterium]
MNRETLSSVPFIKILLEYKKNTQAICELCRHETVDGDCAAPEVAPQTTIINRHIDSDIHGAFSTLGGPGYPRCQEINPAGYCSHFEKKPPSTPQEKKASDRIKVLLSSLEHG